MTCSEERAALFGDRPSYPKPWRAVYHLSWFVVAADDVIVAGPFGNAADAWKYVDAWQAGK